MDSFIKRFDLELFQGGRRIKSKGSKLVWGSERTRNCWYASVLYLWQEKREENLNRRSGLEKQNDSSDKDRKTETISELHVWSRLHCISPCGFWHDIPRG